MTAGKKWYQSLSVKGAIVTAIGFLADPGTVNLLAVLPLGYREKAIGAGILKAAGIVATVIGLRRAIPDASIVQTDDGLVRVDDPTGVLSRHIEAPRNEFGETAGEEARRRASMDTAGADLRRTLEARESGAAKQP
jgi:hypothetical protein